MCIWHYTYHVPCGHWLLNTERCTNSHCTNLQAALYLYHDQPVDSDVRGGPTRDPLPRPMACLPEWPINPEDVPLRSIRPHPNAAAEHNAREGWSRFHGTRDLNPMFERMTEAPVRCICLGWREPHRPGAQWPDARAYGGWRRCRQLGVGEVVGGPNRGSGPIHGNAPVHGGGHALGSAAETALWQQPPPTLVLRPEGNYTPATGGVHTIRDPPYARPGNTSQPATAGPSRPRQTQGEQRPTLDQLTELFNHPTERDGFIDEVTGRFHLLSNVQITRVPFGCRHESGLCRATNCRRQQCYTNRRGFRQGEIERAIEEEEHIATSYAREITSHDESFHEAARAVRERFGTPELVQRVTGVADEDNGEGAAPPAEEVEGGVRVDGGDVDQSPPAAAGWGLDDGSFFGGAPPTATGVEGQHQLSAWMARNARVYGGRGEFPGDAS